MNAATFETALAARVDDMLDACTRCGKCVEVCPSVAPAGLGEAAPRRCHRWRDRYRAHRNGPGSSRKWASSCLLSGECIKACDYGVNPRFLLAMARVAMTKAAGELPERRRARRRELSAISGATSPRCRSCSSSRRPAGAARAGQEARRGDRRRAAGFRVLYRLQRAQDPAHRAARARHHGCARHHLSGDGRAVPLLRRRAHALGRRRDVRPHGHEHHRQAVALEVRPGPVLVPELLRAVHRDDLADGRAPARRAAVRDDAVHAVPHGPARRPAAAAATARRPARRACTSIRASPASWKPPRRSFARSQAIEVVDLQQPAVGLQSVNLSVLPAYKREVQLRRAGSRA